MKNKNSKISSLAFAFVIVLIFMSDMAYGQAPPPPGVPLDFGLSAVIAACVGYGAYRTKK